MTTISYRDGILAADSAISYGTYLNGERCKITICKNYLVAMAGTAWLRNPLEEWVMRDCDPDDIPEALLKHEDKFATLIIDREGIAHEFDNGHLMPIYADYTAIGSGGALALGPMAHGATAEQAVMAACRHDKSSGGPVSTLHFSVLN